MKYLNMNVASVMLRENEPKEDTPGSERVYPVHLLPWLVLRPLFVFLE